MPMISRLSLWNWCSIFILYINGISAQSMYYISMVPAVICLWYHAIDVQSLFCKSMASEPNLCVMCSVVIGIWYYVIDVQSPICKSIESVQNLCNIYLWCQRSAAYDIVELMFNLYFVNLWHQSPDYLLWLYGYWFWLSKRLWDSLNK